jgi:hypothetical protein
MFKFDRKEKLISILVFLILLSSYAYFFPRWADWNQNSRMDLILAIVDKGTVNIDDYYQNTGDYAIYEGHHYATKAPGTSLLGVPVYWVYRNTVGKVLAEKGMGLLSSNSAVQGTLTEGGTDLEQDKLYYAMALYVVTFCIVSIPAALLGVFLYLFTGFFSTSRANRLWVTLIYGLATHAFPYSGSLFGHQIVAALLFISFFLFFLIGEKRLSYKWLPLIGFLMGYAVITEYPAAIIAALITLYGFYRLPRKAWIALVIIGGAIPGIFWMIYNYQIYHSPIGFGYSYAPLYTDKNNVGFFSILYPNLKALWGILFSSYRGMFFLSPVMLLSIPGFCLWFLRGEQGKRSSTSLNILSRFRANSQLPELLVCLGSMLGFILFNGSSVMWDGGYSVGPRYILPMMPFMVFAALFTAERWASTKWGKLIFGILTVWSVLFVWAESIGGQNFPDWSRNPIIEYTLPRLLKGDILRNWGTIIGLPGWLSLLPMGMIAAILLSLLVKTARAPQGAQPI